MRKYTSVLLALMLLAVSIMVLGPSRTQAQTYPASAPNVAYTIVKPDAPTKTNPPTGATAPTAQTKTNTPSPATATNTVAPTKTTVPPTATSSSTIPAWNCNNAYSAGNEVTYNNEIYKALVAVPAG